MGPLDRENGSDGIRPPACWHLQRSAAEHRNWPGEMLVAAAAAAYFSNHHRCFHLPFLCLFLFLLPSAFYLSSCFSLIQWARFLPIRYSVRLFVLANSNRFSGRIIIKQPTSVSVTFSCWPQTSHTASTANTATSAILLSSSSALTAEHHPAGFVGGCLQLPARPRSSNIVTF